MSIDRLAAKIAAVPLNARGRRQYPAALRREIMAALAGSGLTHGAFAEKAGVAICNLAKWKNLAPRPKRTTAAFKAIFVEPEAKHQGLSLKAPGGVVIEGLSVSSAAELLAALCGRS